MAAKMEMVKVVVVKVTLVTMSRQTKLATRQLLGAR